jgi:hypothetical protein
LKFNQPFEKRGRMGRRVMRYQMPLLRRLAAKLVHDILPAALASVIGGFLFTHFQLGHVPDAGAPGPASAEMMQLLRDEHGTMVNFLNAEMAKEKAQLAVAEAAPPPPAAVTDPVAIPRRPAATTIAAKPPLPRVKMPEAAAPQPLVIAQVQQTDEAKPAATGDNSSVAPTAGLKDHVVAVTQRVVSAIGAIPSWIGSIGDRIGGQDAPPRPRVDLVSAS